MLNNDTRSYVENWSKKLNKVEGDAMDEVFDRFSCLYKIYGRLNNDASIELVNKGILRKKGGDGNSATGNVIKYLGADLIFESIENNNQNDVTGLINILPRFHIKFTQEDQIWNEKVDKQLLLDLQSANSDAKVLAILQIIYFVRCNMEHSRKNREDYQVLLLIPLANILKTMNNLLLTEISK